MRSPDLTDVERIERLLGGMPPESEREARLEGLIRELRAAAPPAPPLARERVRTLREPEPRKPFAWRPALVAVPLAAALIGGGLLLSRGGGSGADREAGSAATTMPAVAQPYEWGAMDDAATGASPERLESEALAPAVGGRAQEWDVELSLRVPHNDRLSDASADAIRTTRELGGFVVSSSVSTNGAAGDARLVVRVPSRRIQDAIAQLSALGTITGQRVSIQDRQDELNRLARSIDTLRVQIAELNLRLRTETLTEPERLALELRRQRLTAQLNGVTSQRRGVSREVALAEVVLTISTGKAAAAPPEGSFEGAARLGWEVLSKSGAVLLFLLIVLSPLAVVVALAVVALRSYRRRAEERILEQPRPAATR
jgi:hypothetical protein